MIYNRTVTVEDGKFPVVTWWEDRNLLSPQALSRAKVQCLITKYASGKEYPIGTLMFTRRAMTRDGAPFEVGLPWEKLHQFAIDGVADQLHYSADDRLLMGMITNDPKRRAWGQMLNDGAHVVQASFVGSAVMMELNCAVCTVYELRQLHDILVSQFLGDNRTILTRKLCGSRSPFIAPAGLSVEVYNEARRPEGRAWLREGLEWLSVAVVVTAGVAGILWAVGFLKV